MLPLGHINLTDTCESHMRHIHNMLSIGAGLRAMLVGLAMALLSIGSPAAHADAFGSGTKGTPTADLEARIKALEGLLETLNNKLSQSPQSSTSTATSSSPEAPASSVSPESFVYEPSYEVGGTVNGYIIVRMNGKMQMLTTREYVVFRSRDKARAYKQFLLEQSGMLTSTLEVSATNNGNANGTTPTTGNGTGNNGNGNGNGSGTGTGNGNGNQGNGNGNGGSVMPPPPPPPTPTDGGSGDGRTQALAKKK